MSKRIPTLFLIVSSLCLYSLCQREGLRYGVYFKMIVVYGFSGKKHQILPSILSLIDTHQDVHFDIYITSDAENFSKQNTEYIKHLTLPNVNFFIETYNMSHVPNPNSNSAGLVMYNRLDFPKYHPDIERFLYLDSDTLVLKDLREFYSVNFENNYLQAALDRYPEFEGFKHYINAGVLLFNNQLIVRDRMVDRVKEEYDKYKRNNTEPLFRDQSVINKVFENRILLAPRKYNDRNTAKYNETVVHHFYSIPKPDVFHRNPNDCEVFKAVQCYWDVAIKNQSNPWLELSPENRLCPIT